MANTSKMLDVTCIDCGSERSMSLSYYNTYYINQRKGYRCPKCYKKWRKENWYKEMDDEKRSKISAKRSELSKKVWNDMSDSKKNDIYNRAASTRMNRSEEQKAATKDKIQTTWKNKSDEEKALHSHIRSVNSHQFWDNLSDEDYNALCAKMSDAQRKYFDSLTEEQRLIRAKILRESSQYVWNNMSDEEYQQRIMEMSESRKSEWNNATPEELAERIKHISEGRKRYWESLSDEQKAGIGKQHSKWWKSLSKEAFQKGCLEVAIELNSRSNTSVSNENKNELALKLQLEFYGLNFNTQYYNTKIHPDFNNLFPVNPESGSELLNPYHPWDFIVHTLDGDVLIDVDGSIHDRGPFVSSIKFNDSKRPYQTDNMPAYAVLTYNDDMNINTPVKNICTDEMMTLKELLTILTFMNSSKKDKRKLLEYSKAI